MHAVVATYWGLPLVPALAVRKLWLTGQHDPNKIISTGFDSRSSFFNHLLATLSSWETLPQQLLGTSVMAVFSETTQACLVRGKSEQL
jgi:hypothetical protein